MTDGRGGGTGPGAGTGSGAAASTGTGTAGPTGARTVVVTGGAKGIGEGIVRRLAGAGWRCGIVDLDPSGGLAEELGGAFARADVARPEELETAFAELAERLGGIRALVSCAGINLTGAAETLPIEDWRRVIDVDLSGTYFACRAAFPYLRAGSAVVNVASVLATRARPGRIAYGAAKAGVVAITRVLAVEWAERGIRVNAVAPGWTDTPLIRGQVAGGTLDLGLLDLVPMHRLADVDEVAAAVEFLLGDEASFVTGQTLAVDGGYTWAG